MGPDATFVVCLLTTDPQPNTTKVTVTECSKCARLVRAAPSSIAFVEKRPDVKIVCTECALKLYESDDNPQILGKVPEDDDGTSTIN